MNGKALCSVYLQHMMSSEYLCDVEINLDFHHLEAGIVGSLEMLNGDFEGDIDPLYQSEVKSIDSLLKAVCDFVAFEYGYSIADMQVRFDYSRTGE